MEALHGEARAPRGAVRCWRMVHVPHTIAIGVRIPEGKALKATAWMHGLPDFATSTKQAIAAQQYYRGA
ncbi:hypothetical protein [Cupriavidus agavae]|uniref:Uncharacterized protein n=1 Tax=Cupriavidus agavae TaxID=1001822 RepID=A0A4Q7S026_9BURK|nr:hypothetical protein [Cupriavidus agavae]RZT38660.1 hypothetical protein EV147_3133 [Cupriavidus agavae]